MDDQFDLVIFITGSMLFFVIPFTVIIGIINSVITYRMAKRGQQKSKYYWPKLVGIAVLLLAAGLLLYDGYYKLTA